MQLVVIDGPDKGRRFNISIGEPFVIGRGQDSSTQLIDPHTSRKHCQLTLNDDAAVLTDLGSSAGTYVNGERVKEPRQLAVGDVIELGETKVRYDATEAMEQGTIIASKPRSMLIPDQLPDLIGETISRYQVKKEIAKGQTGTVYLATDTEADRAVALKVLYPSVIASDEEKQRFIRAIKTMLTIRHPNLVATLGAGKTASHCWIAMQYIEGESLTSVIERIGTAGMIDWTYGFRVAVDIGRALQTAHQNNIIHRNIKPSNILIRTSDKAALLGDTLFAKALEGSLAQQITKPGEMIGNVYYMSPEQTNVVKDVDSRADIYSLGATVYAILTGRPPFEGNTVPEVIRKVRGEEPQSPKKWQLSIPDMFAGVVMRMLAKRPEDRFQSADDLMTDLERVGKFQGMKV